MAKQLVAMSVLVTLLVLVNTYKPAAHAKMTTEEMTAKGAMQDADKKSEPWITWAKEKLSDFGSIQESDKQQKHKDVIDNAGDGSTTIRDTIVNAASGETTASDDNDDISSAKKAYDNAKKVVDETYTVAKETMSENAKTAYEVAKEKASEAAGDLGAKMRNDAEL